MAKVNVSESVSQWLSQWQGHLLSCSGQLKKTRDPTPLACPVSEEITKSTPIYWLENASLIILCLVPNNQNIKSHIKCTLILYWVFFHIVLNMLKIGKEKMQCPYCGHKSLNRGNHICRTIFALISPQTFVHFSLSPPAHRKDGKY